MQTPNMLQYQITLQNNINAIKNETKSMKGFASFEKKYNKAKKTNKGLTVFYLFYSLLIMVGAYFVLDAYPDSFLMLSVVSFVLAIIPSFFTLPPLLVVKKSFNSIDRNGLYNYYCYFIDEMERLNQLMLEVDRANLQTRKYLTILSNLGDEFLTASDRLAYIIDEKQSQKALNGTLKNEWIKAFNQTKPFIKYLSDKGEDCLIFTQQYK